MICEELESSRSRGSARGKLSRVAQASSSRNYMTKLHDQGTGKACNRHSLIPIQPLELRPGPWNPPNFTLSKLRNKLGRAVLTIPAITISPGIEGGTKEAVARRRRQRRGTYIAYRERLPVSVGKTRSGQRSYIVGRHPRSCVVIYRIYSYVI